MKAIGLYFGSFNPIHIGHLAIANYAVQFSPVDEVWFVVSPQNPFKTQKKLLDNFQRLELVHRAISDTPYLKASNIEFNLPTPSYTIDTLTYLKEKHPDQEFSILMGADNLFHFHKWKNFEQIRDNYNILVYPRPNIDKELCPKSPNIHWIDAPLMEISSSFIRQSIFEGKDIRHFIPYPAWKYLDEMNFYKSSR